MRNTQKQNRKIRKALTKIQTVIGNKHRANWVKTICLNVYSRTSHSGFGLEMNHNPPDTEEVVRILAITMIKECEMADNIGLLDSIWEEVMNEYREETQTYLQ